VRNGKEIMKHIVLSSHFGEKALVKGARSGEYFSMIELLDAGVDVHAENDLALWNAVDTNFFLLAQALIKAGADVNACDGRALLTAAHHANEDMASLLIRSGAKVDAQDYAALRAAAIHVASGKGKVFDVILNAALKERSPVGIASTVQAPAPDRS
jgi:hypothetical protein